MRKEKCPSASFACLVEAWVALTGTNVLENLWKLLNGVKTFRGGGAWLATLQSCEGECPTFPACTPEREEGAHEEEAEFLERRPRILEEALVW